MRTLDRTSIFDSPSQVLNHIDPALIRPILDRVLVRDVHPEDKIGSIFLPERSDHWSGSKDHIRIGIVVAIGHGDKWIEKFHRMILNDGKVHTTITRKKVTIGGGRWPMQCQVGDKVLVDRRREAEIYIEDVRYYLCHEEQSVLAIIED